MHRSRDVRLLLCLNLFSVVCVIYFALRLISPSTLDGFYSSPSVRAPSQFSLLRQLALANRDSDSNNNITRKSQVDSDYIEPSPVLKLNITAIPQAASSSPTPQLSSFPTTGQPTPPPVQPARKRTRPRIVYPRKSRAPTLPGEFESADDPEDNEEHEQVPFNNTFVPYSNTTVAALFEMQTGGEFVKYSEEAIFQGDEVPSRDRGTHLITTFFRGTYSWQRVRELLSTLVSNLENPYLAAVHVMWEGDDPRWYLPRYLVSKIDNFTDKLVLIPVAHQPTYLEMFEYANSVLGRGAIAVVTNGDIYLDSSIGCVEFKENATRRRAMALSRRHSPLCGTKSDHENDWVSLYDLCYEYTEAHDSFVFAVPLPEQVLLGVNHTQNAAYGAENIVIHELRQAGFAVFNYCFTVRGYHHHCVEERHSHPEFFISRVGGRANRHDSAWPVGRNRTCGEMWVS